MSAELSALFIEQTKKLAALAAAVGLHGDQSAEELSAGGRRLIEDRNMMKTKLVALREENERLRLKCWNGPDADAKFWANEAARIDASFAKEAGLMKGTP